MQNVYATVTMPSIFYIHFSLIFFLHLNSFCHFCRLKYTHALQTLAAHVNRIDLETSSWASLNFMQCEQVQKETEYWFTLLVSCLSLCCSFSQSGNLNRHMRVHGTNGNNMMTTWHRQVSRSSNYEVTYSQQYHTAIYSSASSISCAEELQRLHKKTAIHCTKLTS